jgi:hypothetical protein
MKEFGSAMSMSELAANFRTYNLDAWSRAQSYIFQRTIILHAALAPSDVSYIAIIPHQCPDSDQFSKFSS